MWADIIPSIAVAVTSIATLWITQSYSNKRHTEQLEAQEKQLKLSLYADKKYEFLTSFLRDLNLSLEALSYFHSDKHDALLRVKLGTFFILKSEVPLQYTIKTSNLREMNIQSYLQSVQGRVDELENSLNRTEVNYHSATVFLNQSQASEIQNFLAYLRRSANLIIHLHHQATHEQWNEEDQLQKEEDFIGFVINDDAIKGDIRRLKEKRSDIIDLFKNQLSYHSEEYLD